MKIETNAYEVFSVLFSATSFCPNMHASVVFLANNRKKEKLNNYRRGQKKVHMCTDVKSNKNSGLTMFC